MRGKLKHREMQLRRNTLLESHSLNTGENNKIKAATTPQTSHPSMSSFETAIKTREWKEQ